MVNIMLPDYFYELESEDISIVNAQGKIVFKRESASTFAPKAIETSDLTNGLYILSITKGPHVLTSTSFIKK